MRRAATAAGWVAVVLASACEQPRTELVVRVDSEIAWGPGRRVQSVLLSVRRAGAGGPLRSARTTALGTGAGRQGLPMAVGVVAAGDDMDTPVWVEALGCGDPNGCTAATAVVAQRAVVRFVRGQTQELPLLLASACVGVTCASDQRCTTSGQCEAATRAQETVRPFTGDSDADVDAGTSGDTPATIDRGSAEDRPTVMDVRLEAGFDAGAALDVSSIVDRETPMDVATDTTALDIGPPDTGLVDTAAPDIGPPEGGLVDTAAPDIGPPEGGLVDVGPTDRGSPDTGTAPSCPTGMAYIPGGTFMMGDADIASWGASPPHMVTVSAFCMDLTEVTVAAFVMCTASQCTAPFSYPYCNRELTGRNSHPVNCVSWFRATAFCRWRGGDLPTDAQWEYAARGTDGRTYPWGNDVPPSLPCALLRSTCPVRSFPSLNSPFGLFDMGGNVWEWTADWYAGYTEAAATNPTGPSSGTTHALRGGAGTSGASGLRAAARATFAVTDRSETVGFRCARPPL